MRSVGQHIPMIKNAYLEETGPGKMRHEALLVANELKERGIEFQTFTLKKIQRRQLKLNNETLVVGDMDCSYGAFKQLGIEIPKNNDYPFSLKYLFRRKIWQSTLGQIEQKICQENSTPVFVKPSGRKKCFTGFLAESPSDFYQCNRVSKKEPVFCSEMVNWISEYRVYVVRSKILGIDFYKGNKGIKPDENVIEGAIVALNQGGESYAGYAIDFGVISSGQTALVEMNDGFSVGAYEIDQKSYTDMLIARWEELLDNAQQ